MSNLWRPLARVAREVGSVEVKPSVTWFTVIHLQGNFDKAVEILKPLRYRLDLLGGSRAQVRKLC